MANGIEWSLFEGGVGYDSTVLIQGPGQQGLSQTVICRQAGAGTMPVLLGVEALKRKAGTIVVQGEMADFPNFPIGRVTVKYITIKSARGHSYKACELALQQLASKRFPFDLITTHSFGLNEVDYAIKSVGNEGAKDVIHVSLLPWK
jgi:threonine dehydrogenase-like Zn-dependent dehydrogenase